MQRFPLTKTPDLRGVALALSQQRTRTTTRAAAMATTADICKRHNLITAIQALLGRRDVAGFAVQRTGNPIKHRLMHLASPRQVPSTNLPGRIAKWFKACDVNLKHTGRYQLCTNNFGAEVP